ncbi:MAG: protease HtpX [Gammaproteobacteria bacterium]|nr:protease HtpX [Gammaproteobacteria bacterium]
MKRILLFLATNLAVLLVLSVSFRLLGLDGLLKANGGLDMNAVLVLAAVIGMGGSFISLAISKWSAKTMTGAQVIEQPRNASEAWLLDTIRHHAQRAGIGMPEVAVYESPDMNAFATGMSRDHAMVAVSTGLLASMRRDEIEAVLGHEITHVANGDMVTLALIQGVLNTFVIAISRIIGYAVDRAVFQRDHESGPGFFIVSIVAQLVLGVFATIIVMWFSRHREFRADAGGARLAGAQNMIAALQRLKLGAEEAHLPQQMAAFGISGGIGQGLARLFMSHPPLDERIAALQGHV